MKKWKIALIASASALAVSSLAGLMITGAEIGWGPFTFLFWKHEVKRVRKSYPAENNQGGIVFYGASNFRLWTEMDEDLSQYMVVNAGFGGSTDRLMVKYASDLLYPYGPEVVFFQTGSNDYVSAKGSDEEKVLSCMEYKKTMFGTFHEKLPDAQFVIMSGLLLPGRSQYTLLTEAINAELKEYAEGIDFIRFVDAESMTYDGSSYRNDLFESDGIHLNHEGQLKWRDEYILPCIESLEEEYSLNIRR